MDLLYGHDRKLDYLDETDMVDFLDSNDIFQTPVTGFPTPEECYGNDWLTSFLDDPVLNDKMMTDAMQPPCIKSEHSYSINDHNGNGNGSSSSSINGYGNHTTINHDAPGSPLGLAKCEDMDSDFFCSSSALDLTIKQTPSSHTKSAADAFISSGGDAFLASSSSSSSSPSSSSSSSSSSSLSSSSLSFLPSSSLSSSSSSCLATIKVEPETATASTSTLISASSSSSRQPTIIVTTTSPSSSFSSSSSSSLVGSTYLSSDLALPSIEIKEEPADSMLDQSGLECITLPPTPPGSSGSDSEGSQSPHRSAPNSPIRHSSSLRHHHHSPLSPSKPYSQPLFVNPISQSGVLLLSEEEKRTLISEGYPIPSKLPLTKQEEKNLKKIRRKIKNKISAQESRRKKKEYLEALEKRVESYNHENSDLKKKLENLETSNRSLISQLQKLQSLVKMPKASQTGTALMVLVFCFAVFLGSMSPSSLNIGYATKPARLGFVPQQQQAVAVESQRIFHGPEMGPMMMTAHDTSDPYDAADPYGTPKLKSRMLMSVDQEEYCDDFRAMPWFSAPASCPMGKEGAARGVVVASPTSEDTNTTEEEEMEEAPPTSPGVDMMGGADLPDRLMKTKAADTTVVMVMTGMENNSHSQEVKMMNSVIPDVTLTPKDIRARGHYRMGGNFSAPELETA